eukprot:1954811-Amphidinium_carterae.2
MLRHVSSCGRQCVAAKTVCHHKFEKVQVWDPPSTSSSPSVEVNGAILDLGGSLWGSVVPMS